MEAQQTTTADYLFKLWPWFEANAKRIAFGAIFLIIAVFVFSFYTYRQNQRIISAGEALTQAGIANTGSQLADACLKIAADYAGTPAATRALLQAATTLFAIDRFADAQTQFQKFLDSYPDDSLAPQAALGVAASLDAQGKTDLAVSAYQKAISLTADASVVATAKLALARIDEAQGKTADAEKIYTELVRTYPGGAIASEAEMRNAELKTKSPVATTTVTPAPTTGTPVVAPFTLSH